MDRLTAHSKQTSHENGICCTHFLGFECIGVGGNCARNCKWEEAAWSRLAAYKDTGLKPAEVSELLKDWSDLCTVVGECGGIDMIREICKAGKEKRLVVLPFRVGAKVYTIFGGEVVEKTAIEFRVNGFSKPGVSAVLATDTLAPVIMPLRFAIGQTVFLTREDAENALEATKDG